MALRHAPPEVRALYQAVTTLMDTVDDRGRKWGNAKFGAYAFYDFDGEPIYVGRTTESLRRRIARHLTNQRTDAEAMNVLDPYEVASVEMWPLWELGERSPRAPDVKQRVAALEWSVYVRAINRSEFGAVLNEGDIVPTELIELPPSVRRWIAPLGWEERNLHPDVRTQRRANTIARLAQVCAERDVSPGLRRTLVTQARRLLILAERRTEQQLGIEWPDVPQLPDDHWLLKDTAVDTDEEEQD